MKKHWCKSCRGTGKIVREEFRIIRGVKKPYAFAVDCPGKLAEQIDAQRPAGQDRATGETDGR